METNELPPRASRFVGYSDTASVSSSQDGHSRGSAARSARGRSLLLKRRPLPIAKHANELRRGGNASLSPADRLRIYGGNTIPIPVPLLPGESESEHEQSFERWLGERGYALADVQHDANKERSLRTSFAIHKTTAWMKDPASRAAAVGSKRGRVVLEEDAEDSENDLDDGSKRTRRDMTLLSADILLRQRVLTVGEYRREAQGPKLTEAERRQRYGTATEPIPVPLFPGETVNEYEMKYLAYQSTATMDLRRLADEPNTERSMRIMFARKRLTGKIPMPPVPTPREVELASPAASKPSVLQRVGDARHVAETHNSSAAEPPHRARAPVAVEPTPERVDKALQFPTRCSFTPPPVGSDDSAVPKAYLACGCRKCLLRCTSRLVRAVAELQQSAPVVANGTAKPVMDLTRDTDTAPPPVREVKGVDVAKMLQVTSLIRSRRQRETCRVASIDDPIEQQLQAQYDEINDRIVMNQRVLEHSAVQLEDMSSDHIQQATLSQDENQELRALIEDEMDHRDAAMAMLLVYMWRHAPEELRERVTTPSATDVIHVQRACHLKCHTLALELSHLQTLAASLKLQLDAVLSERTETHEDSEKGRLSKLQQIGSQLTAAEESVAKIHVARRRELATLVHFDAHVRELVVTLLSET